jgi:rhodanese-related sulfurtransferase
MKYFFYLSFLLLSVSSCAQSNAQKLECKKFQQEIASTKNAIIVDVRSEGEFQGGHLAKALNINYNAPNFSELVAKLDKNKPYFVYCAAGVRSARGAGIMRSMGFSKVVELQGGLNACDAATLPLEK